MTNTTTNPTTNTTVNDEILVLGGTGKIGRRVAERLTSHGVPVRIGSRSATPPFDWEDPATWDAALAGVRAAFIVYSPDISVPGAAEAVGAFARRALAHGVRRLVLLSAVMDSALPAESALRDSGADWTIVSCRWFAQNFSEEFVRDLILGGEVTLPTGDQAEPFVDAEDIADVAAAALLDTTGRHSGRRYELSGPRALTLADVTAQIAKATGRELHDVPITPADFRQGMVEAGLPPEFAELVTGIFLETFSGKEAAPTDGVRQALGREPRDFPDYVRRTAATGVWDV
ncbi:NmrA family NAD(P)-binding protein [Streptomyces sp. 6N223]|uniref:NmrA family NAD(P)-binding protein n=1 Tax=Streptomyces sp. 6N223 TaxID=3457412 RepID=UPI003FCFE7E2